MGEGHPTPPHPFILQNCVLLSTFYYPIFYKSFSEIQIRQSNAYNLVCDNPVWAVQCLTLYKFRKFDISQQSASQCFCNYNQIFNIFRHPRIFRSWITCAEIGKAFFFSELLPHILQQFTTEPKFSQFISHVSIFYQFSQF